MTSLRNQNQLKIYLELRREDAPSEPGGSPWLLNRFMFGDSKEETRLANNFSRMSTSYVQPPISTTTNQQTVGLPSTALAGGKTTTFANGSFVNQYQPPWRNSRVDPKNNEVNACCLCEEEHRIHKCPKYIDIDASDRFEKAKKMQLCYNCLTKDYFTSQCKSKNSCFNAGCTEQHHTSLHEYFTESKKEESAKEAFNGT